MKKSKESSRDLWESIKQASICIIGIPEGEERHRRVKDLFGEIMAENFCDLGKKTEVQIQKAQRVPNKMNPKEPTPRYIIITLPEVKEGLQGNI